MVSEQCRKCMHFQVMPDPPGIDRDECVIQECRDVETSELNPDDACALFQLKGVNESVGG